MLFYIKPLHHSILRHEMMDFMFADPTMLDDLDYLFKSDLARRLMFYHQPEYKPEPPPDKSKMNCVEKYDDVNRPNMFKMQVFWINIERINSKFFNCLERPRTSLEIRVKRKSFLFKMALKIH